MTKRTFIVDVIVGELGLLGTTRVAHLAKNPLCPVIGIQISNGPLLYIPFLAPESITNYVQHIHNGHQFLPFEVEESYLRGGKFLFHKGKSCLYKIANESSQDLYVKKGASCSEQGFQLPNITLVVMNALTFPPVFFGKSSICLLSQDGKYGTQGKVYLRNHIGNLVGQLTISVTLKPLGEEMALNANELNDNCGLDFLNSNLHNLSNACGNDHLDLSNERLLYERCISDQRKNAESEIHESAQPKLYTGGAYEYAHNVKCCHESSEEIASQIAELVKRDDDDEKEMINILNVKSSHNIKKGSTHPSPIFYCGHNFEAERLWTKKIMDPIVLFDELVASEEYQNTDPQLSLRISSSDSKPVSKNASNHSFKFINNISESASNDKAAQTSNEKVKIQKIYGPLKHPKGWLRSTPVISCKMHKGVFPILTRTSLLRRAKVDPQLAYHLKSEVDYQVKQKLLQLEKKFKDDLLDVRKKKQLKNDKNSILVSVGCQAGHIVQPNEEKHPEIPKDLQRDFAQQTAVSQTINQSTQISKDSFIKSKRLLENKGIPIKCTLEKNQTFDIEASENNLFRSNSDFEVITPESTDPGSISEAVMHDSSKYDNDEGSLIKEVQVNHSSSTSKSELKKHNTRTNTTNRTRDNMTGLRRSSTPSNSVGSLERHYSRERDIRNSKTYDRSSIKSELTPVSSLPVKIIGGNTDTSAYENNTSSQSSLSEVYSLSHMSSGSSDVSEASNLSKEVYEEIMKGKKADVLLRNGSLMQKAVSEATVSEDLSSKSLSIPTIEENQRNFSLEKANDVKSNFIRGGETFSFGEVIYSDINEDHSVNEHDEITSDSEMLQKRNVFKETRNKALNKTFTKSASSYKSLDKHQTTEYSENLSSIHTPVPAEDSEGIDTSVSNISARIAALLMPKQLLMASVHTDSISSYLPSNVSDTLSSLSDME